MCSLKFKEHAVSKDYLPSSSKLKVPGFLAMTKSFSNQLLFHILIHPLYIKSIDWVPTLGCCRIFWLLNSYSKFITLPMNYTMSFMLEEIYNTTKTCKLHIWSCKYLRFSVSESIFSGSKLKNVKQNFHLRFFILHLMMNMDSQTSWFSL